MDGKLWDGDLPVRIQGEDYYTVAEAAEMVNRQPATVRRWLNEGLIDGWKDSTKHWMITPSSLERFLAGDARK